jgi:hypothetical protein
VIQIHHIYRTLFFFGVGIAFDWNEEWPDFQVAESEVKITKRFE